MTELVDMFSDQPLEVYVAAPERAPDEQGACPFAQRVLIMLEELNVPYCPLYIQLDEKPAWFHLVHVPQTIPVVCIDGHLISESAVIVDFLVDRFGKSNTECPRNSLHYGLGYLSRFHRSFIRTLRGDKFALKDLNQDLRTLNSILKRVHGEGDCFSGIREDASLAPLLYNAHVTGQALLQWSIPEEYDVVLMYLEHAQLVESFRKTKASTATIVAFYKRIQNRRGSSSTN